MSKVSQKDIAESLNISRVTVTKALQSDPEIARETVRKVKERALEMGYIPDFIGRSLASKRTFTIGLVVPKIAHSSTLKSKPVINDFHLILRYC